jgi:hypothetical protein
MMATVVVALLACFSCGEMLPYSLQVFDDGTGAPAAGATYTTVWLEESHSRLEGLLSWTGPPRTVFSFWTSSSGGQIQNSLLCGVATANPNGTVSVNVNCTIAAGDSRVWMGLRNHGIVHVANDGGGECKSRRRHAHGYRVAVPRRQASRTAGLGFFDNCQSWVSSGDMLSGGAAPFAFGCPIYLAGFYQNAWSGRWFDSYKDAATLDSMRSLYGPVWERPVRFDPAGSLSVKRVNGQFSFNLSASNLEPNTAFAMWASVRWADDHVENSECFNLDVAGRAGLGVSDANGNLIINASIMERYISRNPYDFVCIHGLHVFEHPKPENCVPIFNNVVQDFVILGLMALGPHMGPVLDPASPVSYGSQCGEYYAEDAKYFFGCPMRLVFDLTPGGDFTATLNEGLSK